MKERDLVTSVCARSLAHVDAGRLGCRSAQPQPAPLVGVRLIALLFLALLCVSAGACVKQTDACTVNSGMNCDWTVRVEMDDPRFGFPHSTPSPIPSPTPLSWGRGQDFWLSAGDDLVLYWRENSFLFKYHGATCDFNASTLDTNNCRKCNWCVPNSANCGFPLAQGSAMPELLTFPQFDTQSPPTETDILWNAGCGNGYAFEPSQNATYQLKALHGDPDSVVQTKAFVVKPGAGQTVTYQLQLLDQPGVTGAVFYSGTVPSTPLLSDNFNTTLRVTEVRVLKGQPDTDPLTGKLRLNNASIAHPSRLVFIPDYQGGPVYGNPAETDNRCYADPGGDGTLDLTTCHHTYGDMTVSPVNATPAYLTDLDPTHLVTWVAEFKATQGGVDPMPATGEVVAIEFTIVASAN